MPGDWDNTQFVKVVVVRHRLRVVLFPSLLPILRNRFQQAFPDIYNARARLARCSAPSPHSLRERLDGQFLIDIPLDDQVNIMYIDPETEGIGGQDDSCTSALEVRQGCRFRCIVDRCQYVRTNTSVGIPWRCPESSLCSDRLILCAIGTPSTNISVLGILSKSLIELETRPNKGSISSGPSNGATMIFMSSRRMLREKRMVGD